MADKHEDIDSLGERIAKVKSDKLVEENRVKNRSAHTGTQAGIEFVLSVVLGGYMGYLLDNHFGTTPLFLISLFFLGCAAGFMSIFRANKKMGSAIGYSQLHKEEKQVKTLPKNIENVLDKE